MHSELLVIPVSLELIINGAFRKKIPLLCFTDPRKCNQFLLEENRRTWTEVDHFPSYWDWRIWIPKTIVSKLMFDVVFRFSSSHIRKNLQEVHFLLSPQDIDNIQVVLLRTVLSL